MIRLKPTEDIQPLTTFRANVAAFVDQVRESHRPLVLTQHGRGAAVLMGAEDYEALVEELEALRDVEISLREIAAGKTVEHEDVIAELKSIAEASRPK